MNECALLLREIKEQSEVALDNGTLQPCKVFCTRNHRLHEGVGDVVFVHQGKELSVLCRGPFFAGKAEEGLLQLLVDALESFAHYKSPFV
jgi:hypothetical protein